MLDLQEHLPQLATPEYLSGQCLHENKHKRGFDKFGRQRMHCNLCNCTWTLGDLKYRIAPLVHLQAVARLFKQDFKNADISKLTGLSDRTVRRKVVIIKQFLKK